jgi:hypothetical protein
MPEPVVSVVVPTHNRSHLLSRLIAALRAQEGVGPFEIIVVDDGSDDATPEVLGRLAAAGSVPISAPRLAVNKGPAAARNEGWRRARAPLVAFIDDDCTPERRWLASLVEALGGADLAQGKTVPDPDQMANRNAFSHTVVVEGEWGYYESCNIGYRRALLERLGGFDEAFRSSSAARHRAGPMFGEDTDLAWRAKAAGARIAFEPGAVVLHDVRPQTYIDHLGDEAQPGDARPLPLPRVLAPRPPVGPLGGRGPGDTGSITAVGMAGTGRCGDVRAVRSLPHPHVSDGTAPEPTGSHPAGPALGPGRDRHTRRRVCALSDAGALSLPVHRGVRFGAAPPTELCGTSETSAPE